MNTLGFFLRISWNALRRGGQRAFVALLCITFGVMSLVSMTLVSQAYRRAVVLEPGEQLGADLSLSPPEPGWITPERLRQLEDLQQSGAIEHFTLIGHTSSLTYRLPGSGELHFAAGGLGIDPLEYPLAGALVVSEPGNVGAATLLQEVGDAIITRDIAEETGLRVGDRLVLADLGWGAAVAGWVRGIAADTPNHQGSKVYYTLATAQALTNGKPAANLVLVNAPRPEALVKKLRASGWQATSAAWLADNNRQARDLFDLLLKGAGMLGLLVGGIGVAHTMQVLLRRRQKEVAIWKALGYAEGQLQALFAGEAALLGALGSLLGAGLGLLVSGGLLRLFSRTGNLLVSWEFSPYPVALGMLAGILTTVIFAMGAIAGASRAQPAALLRNEPVQARQIPWAHAAGLALFLGLAFTALASLVMGSLLKGIGLLLFALAGLLVLGGLFGGFIWAITRLLPLGRLPLARLAQTSLRRRGLGLIFAMIALFTGIVALALGAVVTENARNVMEARTIRVAGPNVQVIAPADQEEAVRQALRGQKIEKYSYGYQTEIARIQFSAAGEAPAVDKVLVGRSAPGEYQIEGAEWGRPTQGVYTPDFAGIPAGSRVEITFLEGKTVDLEVVGSYTVGWDAARLPPVTGLLMPAEAAARLAQPEVVTFFIQAPIGHSGLLSAALGDALPEATVIDLQAYAGRYTRQIRNLFVLAVAMASLALLAGALLVANSASLAMLDRRYEIGILKAVGYSQGHILAILAVEYGIVGVMASAAGLAAVQVALWIVVRLNGLAEGLLVLSPAAAALIGLAGAGLVLGVVFAVTRKATAISPAVVLNERT